MTDESWSGKTSIDTLRKRERELQCLYHVQEYLRDNDKSLDEICPKIIKAIVSAWQYSDMCRVKIIIHDLLFESSDLAETPWVIKASISCQKTSIGSISIYYTEEKPASDIGPFLKEEFRLLQTIACLLGQYILRLRINGQLVGSLSDSHKLADALCEDYLAPLEIFRQIDNDFYFRISRKMLYVLRKKGIAEARELLQTINDHLWTNKRKPAKKPENSDPDRVSHMTADFGRKAFDLAGKHLSDESILQYIMKWIQEDKLGFLAQVINRNLSIAEVADAIRRYYGMGQFDPEIQSPGKSGIEISLIRRFLSEQPSYINSAKNFLCLRDFYELLGKIIFSVESRGKLGGKSAGMILADKIIKCKNDKFRDLRNIKIPRTWYITSDVLYHFMHYNNLDEIVEQKYKSKSQIRLEYPYIDQLFKNAHFPEDIKKGLSTALDDFNDCPIIVRNSSLLEDQTDTSFSGKYKSIILANKGSKEERLEALTNAIAEVYASTFGPEPIEYRVKSGLLDYSEEMGLMIQEVVGTRVGDYFLPVFSGVAYCSNRLHWSHEIKSEDGLVCVLPGLGNRKKMQTVNCGQVFASPGQPNPKSGLSLNEINRNSPQTIDVINLKKNSCERLNLNEFLMEYKHAIPGIENIFSNIKEYKIVQMDNVTKDSEIEKYVATFEGLFSETPFLKQIHTLLQVLEDAYEKPVYIEFASNGTILYLLQCRTEDHMQN